jgi:hypothetical protein
MFGKVRDDVRAATGMRQEPAVYESLGGEQFYMAAATETPAAKTPGAEGRSIANAGSVDARNAAPPDPKMMDLTYWQSVEASNDPAQLKSYLDQYPNGAFAALAKDKIAALQAPAAAVRPRLAARGQHVGAPGASSGPAPQGRTQIAQASSPQAATGQRGMGGGLPAGRFDGPWRVTQTCPNPTDPAHPFVPMGFTVHVHGGRVHGSRGVADQPGWLAIDGVIDPDGSAALASRGVSARAGLNGTPAGSPYSNVLTAHFTESGGEGQWFGKRSCQFTFTRAPIPGGTGPATSEGARASTPP